MGLSRLGSMAIVAPPGVWMIQAACPHQVAVVTVGADGAAAGAGCLPGTTGGAISGFWEMIGSGAGAGAGAGADLAAAAFFSGTANSTSARATDAALTSSRLTHTIDRRFMTSSFLGVGRRAGL